MLVDEYDRKILIKNSLMVFNIVTPSLFPYLWLEP